MSNCHGCWPIRPCIGPLHLGETEFLYKAPAGNFPILTEGGGAPMWPAALAPAREEIS
jgi:hypothetical protein